MPEEVSHTPGPWELDLDDDGVVSGCTFILRMASARDGNGYEPQHRIEYEVPADDESPEQFAEAKANALLIAAAPDLLAALKDLMWEVRDSSASKAVALQAIAKAEGRA